MRHEDNRTSESDAMAMSSFGLASGIIDKSDLAEWFAQAHAGSQQVILVDEDDAGRFKSPLYARQGLSIAR